MMCIFLIDNHYVQNLSLSCMDGGGVAELECVTHDRCTDIRRALSIILPLEHDRIYPYSPEKFLAVSEQYFGRSLLTCVRDIFVRGSLQYVEELLPDHVNFLSGPVCYTVEQGDAYATRRGDGGERQTMHVLSRDAQPLLVTCTHRSWYTYSDDSEDYPLPTKEQTYLLGEDSIARAVFETLLRGTSWK